MGLRRVPTHRLNRAEYGNAVRDLLAAFRTAADLVTDTVLATTEAIPPTGDRAAVERLVGRGRGLLAHGLGRLTLHTIGRRVGVTDDDTAAKIVERLTSVRASTTRTRKDP